MHSDGPGVDAATAGTESETSGTDGETSGTHGALSGADGDTARGRRVDTVPGSTRERKRATVPTARTELLLP